MAVIALAACGPPSDDTTMTAVSNATNATEPGATTNPAQTTADPTTGGGPVTTDTSGANASGVETSSTTSSSSTTSMTSATSTTSTSTSSGTTGDASTTSSNSGTSGNKIDMPAPPACDLLAQDCPAGQKCMPYASNMGDVWDSVKCVDVVDNGGIPGQACTVSDFPTSGIDTCDATSMCWNVDPVTLKGECYPFCYVENNFNVCKKFTQSCVIVEDALPLCFDHCHPWKSPCPVGEVCVPQLQYPTLEFVCVPDESGAGGQEFSKCTDFDTCDPGLICMDPKKGAECDQNAMGCCLSVCDLSQPKCKGVNQKCQDWFKGNAPPGYEGIGVCAIP